MGLTIRSSHMPGPGILFAGRLISRLISPMYALRSGLP